MRVSRGWLSTGFWLGAAMANTTAAHAGGAPAEIVVAIRYLQQAGVSHSHLYLYRADGKLLRQLTKDDNGQDSNPVFAPDGETIVFTRVNDSGGTDFWSVEPRGGNLHQILAAPAWYAGTKTSPTFRDLEDDPDAGKPRAGDLGGKQGAPNDPPVYRAPDGSVEMVLEVPPADGKEHGKSYLLRDLKTGASVEMSQLAGGYGPFDLLALEQDKDQRFLIVPPLRVAFFGLHLNSTDGSTVFALDLAGKRLVRLSPNGALPVPLPDEPAFLTLAENRYVPFGDGKKTANCSYLEHWDAGLKKVRYAREGAAAACYGASLYRPGKIPATVNVHYDPK